MGKRRRRECVGIGGPPYWSASATGADACDMLKMKEAPVILLTQLYSGALMWEGLEDFR
jgi:hypothetical protein